MERVAFRFQAAGPITFSGMNSYSGGTIVDANNTLIGTTTSLQGSIVNSGLVRFDQTANGTYSGNICPGAGSVEFSGDRPDSVHGNQ